MKKIELNVAGINKSRKYDLMSVATKALRAEGFRTESSDLSRKCLGLSSYEEVLQVVKEYCNIVETDTPKSKEEIVKPKSAPRYTNVPEVERPREEPKVYKKTVRKRAFLNAEVEELNKIYKGQIIPRPLATKMVAFIDTARAFKDNKISFNEYKLRREVVSKSLQQNLKYGLSDISNLEIID